MWDLTNRGPKERLVLETKQLGPANLLFAPDGNTLARVNYNQANAPNTFVLWDLSGERPREYAEMKGTDGNFYGVAFSSDGKTLAWTEGQVVRLWDLKEERPTELPPYNAGTTNCLAFSPDAKQLALGSLKDVLMIDAVAMRRRAVLSGHVQYVRRVAFSPDGQTLASGGEDGTVRLWDLSNFKDKFRQQGHSKTVYCAVVSPDGRTVATSAGGEKDIHLWDVSKSPPAHWAVLRGGHESEAGALSFSPDGRLLASTSFDKTVRLWEFRDGGARPWVVLSGHTERTLGSAFAPNGKLLATGSEDNTIRLWDLTAPRPRLKSVIQTEQFSSVLGFTLDSRILVAWVGGSGIHRWDVSADQPEEKPRLEAGSTHWGARLSSDGSRVTVLRDQEIYLFDLSLPTPELIERFQGHTSPVRDSCLSPDGKWLASSAEDGRVLVYDVSSAKIVKEWQVPEALNLSFAPDGRHLFLTHNNGCIYVLRLDFLGGVAARTPSEPRPAGNGDPDRRAAEFVLSIGSWVGVNDEERDIKTMADLPKEPFRLTHVGLQSNQKVTDADLVLFRDCKNLTRLFLYSTPVTDAGLANFKNCKNLIHLELANTHVTDAGLAHFKDCKNRSSLSLNNTRVTDAGLAYFKDCKNLTNLALHGTQVRDVGVANFKDCKKLTGLSLFGTRVTDAGLAYLQDCKNLTHLWLAGTAVTDAGLKHLEGLTNLTELDLRGTQVTAEGVAALQKALPKCKIVWHGPEKD